MASSTPFDGTNFLTAAPDVDQPHGNDYQEHQSTRKSMEFVNNKEHTAIGNDPSVANAGGEHKNGSSVAYFTPTAPTLRPDGVTALADNDVDKGRAWFDTTDNAVVPKKWNGSAWELISTTPSGVFMPYGGDTAPTGWLLCDGTTGLSTTANPEYTSLFAVIGVKFGGVDTNDFDLPDMREKIPVGVKSGGTFNAIGDIGGAEDHTLLATESGVASHKHGIGVRNSAGTAGTFVTRSSTGSATATLGSAISNASAESASSAHNNLQPYLVANYIIKI